MEWRGSRDGVASIRVGVASRGGGGVWQPSERESMFFVRERELFCIINILCFTKF